MLFSIPASCKLSLRCAFTVKCRLSSSCLFFLGPRFPFLEVVGSICCWLAPLARGEGGEGEVAAHTVAVR